MKFGSSVESRDADGFGEFILTRKVPLTRFKPCRFWELERQAHLAASHARSRCCFCSFCRCTFIFRFRRKSATHAVAYTARARRSSSLKMRRPSWLSRSSACCSNLRFVRRDLSHQIARHRAHAQSLGWARPENAARENSADHLRAAERSLSQAASGTIGRRRGAAAKHLRGSRGNRYRSKID